MKWELRGNHAIPYVSSGSKIFVRFAFNHMKVLDLFLELELKADINGLVLGCEEMPHSDGGHVLANELAEFELERHRSAHINAIKDRCGVAAVLLKSEWIVGDIVTYWRSIEEFEEAIGFGKHLKLELKAIQFATLSTSRYPHIG